MLAKFTRVRKFLLFALTNIFYFLIRNAVYYLLKLTLLRNPGKGFVASQYGHLAKGNTVVSCIHTLSVSYSLPHALHLCIIIILLF